MWAMSVSATVEKEQYSTFLCFFLLRSALKCGRVGVWVCYGRVGRGSELSVQSRILRQNLENGWWSLLNSFARVYVCSTSSRDFSRKVVGSSTE
jgi:hypothetical protein